MKSNSRLALASVALVTVVTFGTLAAQEGDQVTNKTQLLSEALKAREEGDLKLARERYQQLQKIDPTDEAAREGLASVNAALAALSGNKSVTVRNGSLLDEVASSQQNLYREVTQAVALARQNAAQGNYGAALRILDGAANALPNNTASQSYRDEISLARQDVLLRRGAGDQEAQEARARSEFERIAQLNESRVQAASDLIDEAEGLLADNKLNEATETLNRAKTGLPSNVATAPVVERIKTTRSAILSRRAYMAMDATDMTAAEGYVKEFESLNGADDSASVMLREELTARKSDPAYRNIKEVSPGLTAKDEKVQELLVKGRARYLYGDYTGALETYREVLQYQPNNSEAKAFQVRIRQTISENSGLWNRSVTKGKLFETLDEAWKLPELYNREVSGVTGRVETDPVLEKLRSISVPEINIRDMPLDRAISQLIVVSQSYDKDTKGVNMVVIDPEHKNPSVNPITLRGVSLEKALDIITKQVNFTYEIRQGIIEIRPDTGSSDLETEFFPLNPSAISKITGNFSGAGAAAGGAAASPFSGGGGTGAGATDTDPRNEAIKNFLIRSGVSFDATGAQLNFDGANLIVTQNRKNLERIRNIIRRYSDIKQVQIEAKFIEVTESSLNELSSNLRLSTGNTIRAQSNLRSANQVFGSAVTNSNGLILVDGAETSVPNQPPKFPTPNYGGTEPNFGGATGWNGATGNYAGRIGTIGSYDLSIFIRALEQNSGSDLMSAPSLTVMDQKTAVIKVAQLLRYPQSYSDIQAQVGSQSGGSGGGGTGGGGNSVAVTAGTPQDFTVENVGVTLEVTPAVSTESDTIGLMLKPRVTEFEGFVEYGGTSVAISGTITVTVPSGFFQPIFSVREVQTEVTVFDGATAVIGGLTREEVKTVNDKVPVLGDIPVVGTAFRSTSKSTVKKNLMIFVTANLVSPGGSTQRNNFPGMRAGSTFSNPVIISPGGAVYREPIEATETPSGSSSSGQ